MSTTQLRLSVERAIQLSAIARARDTTVQGLIDQMVQCEFLEGTVPDATPGIAYSDLCGSLQVKLSDEKSEKAIDIVLTLEEARQIAAKIGESRPIYAVTAATGDTVATGSAGAWAVYFEAITSRGAKIRRVWTHAVAADVQRQMRAACDAVAKV